MIQNSKLTMCIHVLPIPKLQVPVELNPTKHALSAAATDPSEDQELIAEEKLRNITTSEAMFGQVTMVILMDKYCF